MTFRLRALVEDRGHEHLLRGLLDRIGSGHGLRVDPYPKGRGAAEQHVRTAFPQFVRDLRTKRNQRGLWGIVVIDGDVDGMARRREALCAALAEASLAPLGPGDRVLLLVPTRNVETWAWCLLGHEVDEETDFKPQVQQSLRTIFAAHWLPARPKEPPSLVAGRLEWARLV